MYSIEKKLIISFAHRLYLAYESPCSNLHGHNWKVKIYLECEELNTEGMVLDFMKAKKQVMNNLDHKTVLKEGDPLALILTDIGCSVFVVPFNTTSENFARWIGEQFTGCQKVEVEETPDNKAIWEKRR